jgi:hypothetical protein
MHYHNFPPNWLQRLGLNIFSFNERLNISPNLWCVCSYDLYPNVIDIDDQQVSFSLTVNNIPIFISAIYASTSIINRKNIWFKLSNLQNTYDEAWIFIGDFNTVMGAHEHSGSFTPARPPIEDFQQWTDSFNLIHLPTRGATYTWDNRRSGRRHTKRRLDRSIVNQKLLDICSSISCSTLTKTRSDHYPLLLDFNTDHTTFASSLKFLKMWTLHNGCKQLITDCWNTNVVGSPMYVLSYKLKCNDPDF